MIRFCRPKSTEVDDRFCGFLQGDFGDPFFGGVEEHATGEDVGAGHAFKAETGTVGWPPRIALRISGSPAMSIARSALCTTSG